MIAYAINEVILYKESIEIDKSCCSIFSSIELAEKIFEERIKIAEEKIKSPTYKSMDYREFKKFTIYDEEEHIIVTMEEIVIDSIPLPF